MDELYTFVKKKPLRTRMLTAVDRNKNQICEFFIGEGTTRSLRKLTGKIGEDNFKIACTGGNFACESELEMKADTKYVISKSETCLVKGYNSV